MLLHCYRRGGGGFIDNEEKEEQDLFKSNTVNEEAPMRGVGGWVGGFYFYCYLWRDLEGPSKRAASPVCSGHGE